MAGKPQAEHNEKLCDLLIKKGGFADWVLTSAFYSALHYCDHQIFPLVEGTKGFSDFDDYYKINHPQGNPSKHKVRRSLVAKYLPKCSSAYNWLQDNCFNARYNDYQIKDTFATVAKEKLDIVKGECKKP